MEKKQEILYDENKIRIYIEDGVMTVETPDGHIDHPIRVSSFEYSYEIPTRINVKVRRAVRLTYLRTKFTDTIQRRTTPIANVGMSHTLKFNKSRDSWEGSYE